MHGKVNPVVEILEHEAHASRMVAAILLARSLPAGTQLTPSRVEDRPVTSPALAAASAHVAEPASTRMPPSVEAAPTNRPPLLAELSPQGGEVRLPEKQSGVTPPSQSQEEASVPAASAEHEESASAPAEVCFPLTRFCLPDLERLQERVDSFFAHLGHLGRDWDNRLWPRLAPWLVLAAAAAGELVLLTRRPRRAPALEDALAEMVGLRTGDEA
jgi:hypothetical protein